MATTDEFALLGGTRRDGGYAIVCADQVDDELRSCWTAYLIMYASYDACVNEMNRREREDAAAAAAEE